MTNKLSLAETHPEVAAQAFGWDPNTVTHGSNMKRQWKCSIGHEWSAQINNRVNGTGCPICSNQRVLAGFNDLATTHPELATEADGWDPTNVLSGTDKKYNWKCSNAHKWNASVYSRSKLGIGCPTCSGRILNQGVNDLASLNPKLALEATGWDPTTVKSTSNQKLEWTCNKGHQWFATVSNRMQGRGCPFCAGRKVLIGFNDLSTLNPGLAKEADDWDPKTVTPFSNKKLSWKCKLGHRWVALVSDRSLGTGCPICVGQKILVGFNDLLTTNPDVAKQAFGWDPTTVTKNSNKVKKWRCEHKHIWSCSVAARNHGGCPFCSGRRLAVGFNDLATTNPDLAAEADGWDPTTVTAGIQQKRKWKCKQGHTWSAVIGSRNTGVGCPVCSNKTVQTGFNDLATTHPELAAQADGWDPTTVSFGSSEKKDWMCAHGHRWKTTLADRSSGKGCPTCAGKKVLAGFNDLATTHPELAAQADGWDPTTVSFGMASRMSWKCNHGHRWLAPLYSRSAGMNCPICSGQQLLVGFNDLVTTHPELATEADGWDPTTVTAGSGINQSWKCDKGHVWKTRTVERKRGRGCPTCAPSGFDPNSPGFLYLIDHFQLEMIQVGISNFPKDRLDDHIRRGWEVLELRGPMDGHLTQKLETDCLHSLEKRGARLGHKIGIDKFDGYSEAWTKESLNVTSIKQILDWVYEDEAWQS